MRNALVFIASAMLLAYLYSQLLYHLADLFGHTLATLTR